jgi:hypothetical protein
MANNRLREIWDCGVPTFDAFDNFAGESALPAQPTITPKEHKYGDDEAADIKAVIALAGDLSKALLGVAAANHAPKQWVLNELAEKRLMAIGYTSQPNNSLGLEIVPIPLLKSEFADWKKSKISGLGISFIDVRICPFQNLEIMPDAKKARGRPRYKEQVWTIIDDVGLGDLRNRHNHNKTSIAAEIHKIGLIQFPNAFSKIKPDTQTIIRHYNSYLEGN